jgi:hypothetical protein
MRSIAYRGGYKYQLQEGYSLEISIRPAAAMGNDYITLDPQGALRIAKGYAWDGTLHREAADRILQSLCREDGMGCPRLIAFTFRKLVVQIGGICSSINNFNVNHYKQFPSKGL